MPRPQLSLKEKKTVVDRESLLQPIMSVICPQIEERRDKEEPLDTSLSAKSTFMRPRVCVCICV